MKETPLQFLSLTAQAGAETTILFSGNSFGEFNPCPS